MLIIKLPKYNYVVYLKFDHIPEYWLNIKIFNYKINYT